MELAADIQARAISAQSITLPQASTLLARFIEDQRIPISDHTLTRYLYSLAQDLQDSSLAMRDEESRERLATQEHFKSTRRARKKLRKMAHKHQQQQLEQQEQQPAAPEPSPASPAAPTPQPPKKKKHKTH